MQGGESGKAKKTGHSYNDGTCTLVMPSLNASLLIALTWILPEGRGCTIDPSGA